jgi:hypothetical protein
MIRFEALRSYFEVTRFVRESLGPFLTCQKRRSAKPTNSRLLRGSHRGDHLLGQITISFHCAQGSREIQSKQPITCAHLRGELDLELGVVLIPDTLRHTIARLPFCKTATGVPQEASRVQYNHDEIDELYLELEQNVSGVRSNVVYNFDEGFMHHAE